MRSLIHRVVSQLIDYLIGLFSVWANNFATQNALTFRRCIFTGAVYVILALPLSDIFISLFFAWVLIEKKEAVINVTYSFKCNK